MSFILDALKKSELERQRQSVPGLMDASTIPVRRGFPVWAIALAALLGINLVVLVVVLMRNDAPTAVHRAASTPANYANPENPAAAPAAEAPAAAVTAPRPFSPLDGAPEYAPEIPVVQPGEAVAPAGTPRPAAIPRAAPPSRAQRRPDPLLSDAAADNDEVLPSINELDLTSQGLAELHIDVHVFATKPSDRFVYINMRKYHEGATLQEGPKLERIRRDGAILSYRGVRFLLPRQAS
jgi:general secretion pathway protein B